MKKSLMLFVLVFMCIILVGCKGVTRENPTYGDLSDYTGKITNIEMSVKNYGIIKLELYDDLAPITVENFKKLINEKFYDGLTFHRIMNNFMIQGGAPEGTVSGGSSETIKGEFQANGVSNNLSHVRGVISMARSSSYNSASSQFFIVQADAVYLDGNYAGFGMVTEGMDVVDNIAVSANPTDDNGTIEASEQPIIEYIKIIDETKKNK